MQTCLSRRGRVYVCMWITGCVTGVPSCCCPAAAGGADGAAGGPGTSPSLPGGGLCRGIPVLRSLAGPAAPARASLRAASRGVVWGQKKAIEQVSSAACWPAPGPRSLLEAAGHSVPVLGAMFLTPGEQWCRVCGSCQGRKRFLLSGAQERTVYAGGRAIPCCCPQPAVLSAKPFRKSPSKSRF